MPSLFSFKDHPFTEPELLWLETAAKEKPFDARGARARLHGRVPGDFKPQAIDSRFYNEDTGEEQAGVTITIDDEFLQQLLGSKQQ